MPFIYNRAYAYRGLTAFAPLSMAVSDSSSVDAVYIKWFDETHYWCIQEILTRSQIESAYHFLSYVI
ncbi:MAG: hypothetical protein KZQ59_09280 [Candidatus Thiodiazotropha sp. (ex Lucinoma aequizonata)]|nr:hypothetical protein [Candidatus Thiodiazotropha sp. (ex Lucinoma aequizonata)]